MTTELLLQKHGIIKYRGRLIYVDEGKFWYHQLPYDSLLLAQQKVDTFFDEFGKYLKPGKDYKNGKN